jgi:DNA-binding HxlR family transcriptional regulator
MENIIKVTPRCPIRTTMELVGGKWKMALLYQLKNDARRPSELRKLIPDISEKMLQQELKTLLENDMIQKEVAEANERSVVYSLTENGHAALPIIDSFIQFGTDYQVK